MSALCHRDLASYFLIGGRGALHCDVILSVARLDIPVFTPFLLCLFSRGRLCDLCQDEDAKEPPPQLIDARTQYSVLLCITPPLLCCSHTE